MSSSGPAALDNCHSRALEVASAIVKGSPRRESSGPCDDTANAFAHANRCPLFPGRLNRWVLRRTLRGRPTDAEILQGAGDVLARWFSPALGWGAEVLIAHVRAVARRKALELSGELAAAAQACSPAPLMLGDSFASVAVDFLYFGRAPNMPWPVLDQAGEWLPLDCVWALELAGAP